MSAPCLLESSVNAAAAARPAPAEETARSRWSRRVAVDLVGLFDALAVVVGAACPAAIYTPAGVVGPWQPVVQTGLVAALIVAGCLRNCGLYETTALHALPLRPSRLIAALTIALLAVLGVGHPFAPGQPQLWSWYALWMSASFALLLANRLLARSVLARLTAAGRFHRRVAVFGAGVIARRVHDYLSNPALGITFVGVYDDRASPERVNPEGLPIAGRLDDLIAAGREDKIDQIIVALPQAADRRIADIVKKLEPLPVSVHIVTHIASDLVEGGPAHKVSSLGPVGLLDVKQTPLADWAPLVKRIEDYVLGALALVVTLPLFLVIALAIKLESPGPVFFVQRRRGFNQRVFSMLKFRTMRVLEDGSNIRQATRDDPRITPVGRFLRRTSLDELPQLVNVLKGDMSLVGPRPHALAHDEQWGELLVRYANRHQVKPGITGLAQVTGWRGEANTPDKIGRRIDHDLAYIGRWSLGLDLKILLMTLWAVVQGKNAH
jgi:Undecaprenyl-phosphate glucose phosphotransferase